MPDDPREVLKAAGVECAEVEDYEFSVKDMSEYSRYREITGLADVAIVAMARLVAKYKSAYEAERGHVLRGSAGIEWIRRDLAEEEIAKHKPK